MRAYSIDPKELKQWLGECRGEYMAAVRRAAFKAHYGVEARFPEDMQAASALIDAQAEYRKFTEAARTL